MTHEQLAGLWCQWNNQRGTPAQIARVMRQLSAETLVRLLVARGVIAA